MDGMDHAPNFTNADTVRKCVNQARSATVGIIDDLRRVTIDEGRNLNEDERKLVRAISKIQVDFNDIEEKMLSGKATVQQAQQALLIRDRINWICQQHREATS